MAGSPALATASGVVPDLPTVQAKGVDILLPGTHHGVVGGANTYDAGRIDQIVQAHEALRGIVQPVCKLGHNPDQKLLAADGLPNAGLIDRLYREGDRLKADISGIPAKLGALLKTRNYNARSAELLFNARYGDTTYPCVLTGLSWLGADAPAVKGLNDILALYAAPDQAQETALATLADAAEAVQVVALADAPTQSVGGVDHPAKDFAYVPDPEKPSTWKLCLTKEAGGDPDPGMVGAAAAALGKGFRGQPVDIPDADRAAVVAKVRAAWKKANPDKKAEEMPEAIALAEAGDDPTPSEQAEADAAACKNPKHADMPAALHKKLHMPAKAAMAAASFDEIRYAVEDALEDAYPNVYTLDGSAPSGNATDTPSAWIQTLYPDSVVVWDQDHDELWQIPYTFDAASSSATLGDPQRVRLVPEVISGAELAAATPLQHAQANAPAAATDENGLTTDYAQHLTAIEGALGTVNDHMNALAGKHGIGPARAMHRELTSKVQALKKRLVPNDHTEAVENAAATDAIQTQMAAAEGETVNDTELRALLSLPADADLKQALISLAAQRVELAEHQAVVAERDALLAEKRTAESAALVDTAIAAGKLLPKMRGWAVALAETDRPSLEQFLSTAPSLWEPGERGRSGMEMTPRGERPPSEAALAVAQRMGVSPEQMESKPDARPFAERFAALVDQRAGAASGGSPVLFGKAEK